MDTLSEQRCFGGVQGIYSHVSRETGTPMRFSVFAPPAAGEGTVPVLWYLSGLTCTEENFTVKAGAQRYAAEHGIMLVAPDTSPRGAGIDGEDDDYDFGTGAGFYVDATEPPWDGNYRMYSYVTRELPELVFSRFPGDRDRQGITGHSMGGHGALTIGLRNPGTYGSISAFSPICAPMQCPWGRKALGGYLGEDRDAWKVHDATELIRAGALGREILVDQGDADDFLGEQLKPELLIAVCGEMGQPVNFRMQPGYDHSYHFVATFIGDHVRFHAERLKDD
ncbi:MAG: S-formylglutathione hydrolase [Gammaproteobacteria bacterium]|nr:S-formylglutathione hydrolase [Gammaproteobacteria bacterium]MYG67932.1 S-formylglutathione hydrolase [Gammaproteobacteria bacterium]